MIKKTFFTLLLLMVFITIHCTAQSQWVGPSFAVPESNAWICYRADLNLAKKTKDYPVRIATDTKYWLWINGQQVVFEGGLKHGPSPNDTYVDVVNLAPYLKKGKNTVAVLVWYFGKHGFAHKSSGKTGLLFSPVKVLAQPLSWKVTLHPAYYQTTGKDQPNYRLAESNVAFDARNDMEDWYKPAFDVSEWPDATSLGHEGIAPWGKLIERPIPQWKDFGLKSYQSVRRSGDTLIAKLPYNAQITPWLQIDAPAGITIDIRTDNYMGGSEPNLHAEYITRNGKQEYESLGWMNGHEVRYVIPASIKKVEVKYRETGYNTSFVGSFTCNQPFYNTLWQKSLRTLYITMRDNYMDCPDRERAQWWGDAVIESGEAFYALDTVSYRLAAKGFRELFNWQKDNGVLHAPIPIGNGEFELPLQVLATIGWYGLHNYYTYSGDSSIIIESYPAIKQYLNLWEFTNEGLVKLRTGSWSWGDWGKNVDMNVLANAWYYLALKAQKEYALMSGNKADVKPIEHTMSRMYIAFNKRFWTGSSYRDSSLTVDDDRAQAMAVLSGLASKERYRDLRQVLLKQTFASPYMEKYVLEALFVMGFPEDASLRMQGRYKAMVESPVTTLWEGWELNSAEFGGGTYNHAWSGGPLTLLSQYVAGVAPITPGYGTYEVVPLATKLKQVACTVPTVKGNIEVQHSYDGSVFRMQIKGPANSRQIIGVPILYAYNGVTINGKQVLGLGGTPIAQRGIRMYGQKNGCWLFELSAPKITVEAR